MRATLRALTLNIAVAAPARAEGILAWLGRRDDDVLILTETNGRPGTRLLIEGLAARGYAIHATIDARERGVVVATRLPVKSFLDSQLQVTLPCRVAGVVLDTEPAVAVVGVYVPSRDRSPQKIERKRVFLESLLEGLRRLPAGLRRHALLVGDYNAVARRHEPPLPGFFMYEYAFHDALEQLGLRAAHELGAPLAQPHSWIGRTGRGYLYDYMHVGHALQPLVQRCLYLHGPRQRGLSDHAAVALRLAMTPR